MTQPTYELSTQGPTNLIQGEQIIQDTNDYTIVKQPDGKFRKDMKYEMYYSTTPTDKDEMISLYKILETPDNPDVTPMKKVVGDEISILQVYQRPYQSFDENTGTTTNGVTTTILTETGYIATSSKSVYHTIRGLFKVFGYPNSENYEPIKVKVTETKQQNGMQINLELVSV